MISRQRESKSSRQSKPDYPEKGGRSAQLGLWRAGVGFGVAGGDFPGCSGPDQESRFYSKCSGKGIPRLVLHF